MTVTQATMNKDLSPSVPVVFCVNSGNRALAWQCIIKEILTKQCNYTEKVFLFAIPSDEEMAGICTAFSSTILSVSAVIKL